MPRRAVIRSRWRSRRVLNSAAAFIWENPFVTVRDITNRYITIRNIHERRTRGECDPGPAPAARPADPLFAEQAVRAGSVAVLPRELRQPAERPQGPACRRQRAHARADGGRPPQEGLRDHGCRCGDLPRLDPLPDRGRRPRDRRPLAALPARPRRGPGRTPCRHRRHHRGDRAGARRDSRSSRSRSTRRRRRSPTCTATCSASSEPRSTTASSRTAPRSTGSHDSPRRSVRVELAAGSGGGLPAGHTKPNTGGKANTRIAAQPR